MRGLLGQLQLQLSLQHTIRGYYENNVINFRAASPLAAARAAGAAVTPAKGWASPAALLKLLTPRSRPRPSPPRRRSEVRPARREFVAWIGPGTGCWVLMGIVPETEVSNLPSALPPQPCTTLHALTLYHKTTSRSPALIRFRRSLRVDAHRRTLRVPSAGACMRVPPSSRSASPPWASPAARSLRASTS